MYAFQAIRVPLKLFLHSPLEGEETKMAVSGTWTIFYDWECNGNPSQFQATFNANGTWSGGRFSGNWTEVAGMIMFNFSSGSAIYSANTAGGFR